MYRNIGSIHMTLTKRLLVSILFLCISLVQAQASLIISNTRVIYNEEEGESIVQLKNINAENSPILVQIWMDEGNPNADINELAVPFNILPAISRIDAQKGQAIRVLRTKDIPTIDRESLFWINFLEVPKKPTAQLSNGENLLQVSIRTRLKFFYRPKHLSMNASEAYKKVKLTTVVTRSDYKVVINNPTPYHVTFGSLSIKSKDGKTIYAAMSKKNDLMIAPFSDKTITLKSVIKNGKSSNITTHYTLINDFGSEVSFSQP